MTCPVVTPLDSVTPVVETFLTHYAGCVISNSLLFLDCGWSENLCAVELQLSEQTLCEIADRYSRAWCNTP